MSSPFAQYENRIFLCCGMTRDRFCLPDTSLVVFDEFLYAHLKAIGYERLLFYSHRGLYFFDEFSIRTTMLNKDNRKSPDGGNREKISGLAPGPGGLSLRRSKKQPETAVSTPRPLVRWRYPSLSFSEMITILDRAMKSTPPRTACIFYSDHLDGFMDQQAVIQHFRGVLETDIRSLPASNRNIVVFVFGFSVDSLAVYLNEKPWNFLANPDTDGRNRGIAHIIHIGSPEKDEVERLIHHYRLIRGMDVHWTHFQRLLNTLTAHIKSSAWPLNKLETWLENRSSGLPAGPLSLEAIRDFTGRSVEDLSARERLEQLTGLENVKLLVERQYRLLREMNAHGTKVTDNSNHQIISAGRLSPVDANSIPESSINLHLALKGNSGVGKTTVAGLLGEIYREMGLLELGHTVKATRKDLVAGYVGQTALKTRETIQQAVGGVLFIDEAYSLVQGGENDFGHEALTEILEAMSALRGRFALIIAGYPDEIDTLIDSNPGFKRRFDHILEIDDFTPGQLESIFRNACRAYPSPIRFEPELESVLPKFFEALYHHRPKNFGNAGTVKDEIFSEIIKNTMPDKKGVRRIGQSDFPESCRRFFTQIETEGEPLAELEKLIGLSGVKQCVRDLMMEKEIQRRRSEALGQSKPDMAPGHYLFIGSPGTGKTTVAALMADQLRRIGLLKTDHLKSVSASELIGEYVGQTEERTRKFLEESINGVCFIDEAHQFMLGGGNAFGKNALGVIVPFMETHRNVFSLILAGYPGEINKMLDSDPGFRSRFEPPVVFEDYSADELALIFVMMAREQHLSMTENAHETLSLLMYTIHQNKSRHFGNARTVRQILKMAVTRHAVRLKQTHASRDPDELFMLRSMDIPVYEMVKGMI